MPSPLDCIGRKRFAFYPHIQDADPNSWLLGASSWGEVQVINAQTGRDFWIPRQYVGAVSDSHDSLVVGLTQQLDFRNGEVFRHSHPKVIEMPLLKHPSASVQRSVPANVVAIRLEQKRLSTFQKAPFRVGVALLFVTGLLALVESASR